MRSQQYLSSEAFLPIHHHGLNTTDELRAHAEQFKRAKTEISLGKRRRRNSSSDTRDLIRIKADGPDRRFDDVEIPNSGIRDGLAAAFFMPPFPNVQNFTRRSARWGTDETLATSQHDDSANSSSRDSTYKDASTATNSKIRVVASKRRKKAKPKSRLPRESASTSPMASTDSVSMNLSTESVTYKCYANGCNYTHFRRGNFSIHWKRDAKHKGTFDLGKVIYRIQDKESGKITTIPYGEVKTYRNVHRGQKDTGPAADNTSNDEASATAFTPKVEESSLHSVKRKASARVEAPRKRQTRSSAFSTPDPELPSQRTETSTGDSQVSDSQINLTRASDPRPYSSLECKIFKRLKDVPANFSPDLTPLISHDGPLYDNSYTRGNDSRYFCPQCQKCFTQTHNVASHFSRVHGKQYSKNDRDRTIICRTTVSQSRVNIDAKPIDGTVLPRLVQIQQQRSQANEAREDVKTPESSPDHDSQGDSPLDVCSNGAVPAISWLEKGLKLSRQRVTQSELQLRQSSERIQRMYAVRNGILTRMTAEAQDGVDYHVGGALLATTMDAQGQGNETAQGGLGGENETVDKPRRKRTHARQPSWEDVEREAPKRAGSKRKRKASSSGVQDVACPLQEDEGKLDSRVDTPSLDEKDHREERFSDQTTTAMEIPPEDKTEPNEGPVPHAQSVPSLEHEAQSTGGEEQVEIQAIEEVPPKRRKMTLAEYTALGRAALGRSNM